MGDIRNPFLSVLGRYWQYPELCGPESAWTIYIRMAVMMFFI